MFETFVIGGIVGAAGYFFIVLWDSKYGSIAKGAAVLIGIITAIAFVVILIDFFKTKNNLKQNLIDHPKCELDTTNSNQYTTHVIKADFYDKTQKRYRVLNIPCGITYEDQCKLRQQMKSRHYLSDAELRKYLGFLCA